MVDKKEKISITFKRVSQNQNGYQVCPTVWVRVCGLTKPEKPCPNGCGSKLNRLGQTAGFLVHVSTYQGVAILVRVFCAAAETPRFENLTYETEMGGGLPGQPYGLREKRVLGRVPQK